MAYVIALSVSGRGEVQAPDAPNVGVLLPEELTAPAAVAPHLPHDHHLF